MKCIEQAMSRYTLSLGPGKPMLRLLAIIGLLVLARSAAADFTAAQEAQQHGDYTAAFQACKCPSERNASLLSRLREGT
jgi:hypothetical protein